VPAHCFMPQPKVTSAVISLKVRPERPWDIADQDVFFRVVKASFAMRRKKLANGLASGFPELGKTGAAEVIAACGFDSNVRGETLDIPQFAAIANEIVRRRNHV
ncbi:MAG: 16S rRNA (adenine(1518)-N(6)/adenine(1519)-N(6))-dimethyltransferase, partial [Spirochaetales bacterium]|nr:16S rRNA (adenine(1518)-N(6)/adenine(1519)-N(6))-dimethyltransferase [Spirochaetales bacterium]